MDLEKRLDMSLADVMKLTKKNSGGDAARSGAKSGGGSSGRAKEQGHKARKDGWKYQGAAGKLKVQGAGVKKTASAPKMMTANAAGGRRVANKGLTVGAGKNVAIRGRGKGAAKQPKMPSRPLPKGKKAGAQQGQGGVRGSVPKVIASAGPGPKNSNVIHLRYNTAKEAQATLEAAQRAAIQARDVLRQKGVIPRQNGGLAAGNGSIFPTKSRNRGGKSASSAPRDVAQPQTQIIREIHYVPAGNDYPRQAAPTLAEARTTHVPRHMPTQHAPVSRYHVDPAIASQPPPADPGRRFLDDRNDDSYAYSQPVAATRPQPRAQPMSVARDAYASAQLRAVKAEPAADDDMDYDEPPTYRTVGAVRRGRH